MLHMNARVGSGLKSSVGQSAAPRLTSPCHQRSVKVAYGRNETKLQTAEVSADAVNSTDVPATSEFPAPIGLERYIPSASTPRVSSAPTKEKPEGNKGMPKNKSVLQNHVDFWDRDGDGIIYPKDTFIGFREIGFNLFISIMATPIIHFSFSLPSWPTPWPPRFSLPIYVSRIHRTKHGSDSETYDTEGRFVPDKFEAIFSKFDRDNKGGLNWDDLERMFEQNRNVGDNFGQTAERLEWWATHVLLKNEKGVLTKDRILGVIDGTIWEQLREEVKRQGGGELQIRDGK